MARRPRSLRLELVATLTIVLMMAVVSLSLAAELLGRQRHEQQQRDRLADHTRSLAAIVEPLLDPGAPASVRGGPIEQVLRGSVGSMGIEAIEIHRRDRQRDRSTPLLSLGLAPPLDPPAEAASGEAEAGPDGRLVVDRALRIFGPDRHRHTVVLRVVARPSSWTRLGDWSTTLLLAGGVGLVLLVLGGVLLEVQVLRPLAAVRAAADRVADGQLDAEVPHEGPAEFAALATAFNRMTASLHTLIERNAAQRESLVRAQQLASVGRLSAGVAHEVGNPLAAILGYVDLLLDPRQDSGLDDDQRALLSRTKTQLERISSIVGQLLDYSRPPKGTQSSVPVLDATKRLVALLRHDPRCQSVELRVEGDEEAVAWVDPARLDQVVQNLLVNACRAARQGDDDPCVSLTVTLHREGEDEGESRRVMIDIADNGPGVPEPLRAQIFEPFFTTADTGEGTGLGLAIAQGLVEADGGTLSLHDSPGEGATFRITLATTGAVAADEESV